MSHFGVRIGRGPVGLSVLLASAATLALASGAAASPDLCTVNGTTVTCSGDQLNGVASGVDFASSTTILKVLPDDKLILPADGVQGIYSLFDTTFELKSVASITTLGAADAIAIEGPGAIVINSKGDLITDRRGIYSFSWDGSIDITSKGLIDAGEDGIFAQADGAIDITSKGEIDAGFKGIFANSFNGPITIDSKGNIDALLDAIWAQAQGTGDVSVTSKGTLFGGVGGSSGYGIFANSMGGGTSVYNRGDVTSDLGPIWARGVTDVTVDHEGTLTNPEGGGESRGIYAEATLGFVKVTSVGDIDAGLDAIWARGLTDVKVTSDGILNARRGRGIYAESQTGKVEVYNTGDVTADNDAILAFAASNVVVESVGDLKHIDEFSSGRGIFARSLGGFVTVTSVGDITVDVDGIFAQGTESVSVTSTGDLNTSDSAGRGIFAQSLFKDVSVWSNGDINSYNEAIFASGIDDVTVWNAGDLTTIQGRGIFAQSLNGTVTVDTTGTIVANAEFGVVDGIFASAFSGLEINNKGDVTSNTFRAIYAETVLGPIEINSWGDIKALSTGGANGEAVFADNDGAVTFNSWGDLTSAEFRGVFLQSRANTLTVYSEGEVNAVFEGLFLSGNNIDATILGNVTSSEWRGILASRQIAGNPDGTIELTYGGGIVQSNGAAADKQPHGIEVDAFGGSSYVTILGDGVVRGGSSNSGNFSYGILFRSGFNSLYNYGVIDEANGGRAIGGIDGGDDWISNYGLVKGSIYLGGGWNLFDNNAWGVFETGAEIDVGAPNFVNNWGDLSPGGLGTYQTTTFLSGNLWQADPGQLVIDIDFDTPGFADAIVGVDQATMGGFVRANVHDLNLIYGAFQTATVVTATNVIDTGITGAAQGAVEVTVTTTGTTVDISVALNYAAAGLEGNQARMGGYLQGIFAGGVPGPLQSTFLDLAEIPTTAAYGNAIAALGPEGYAGLSDTSIEAGLLFVRNLLSCGVYGPVSTVSDEGQCAWGAAQARHSSRDGGPGDYGYSDNAYAVAAGVQVAGAGSWRFGFAAGYENGNYSSGTTTADRDLYNIGIVAKNQVADYDFAFALTGGGQTAHASRYIPVPGVTAYSDPNLYFASLTGKVSRDFSMANAYVTPSLELAGTWLSQPSYTETGAGPLNLAFASQEDFFFRASPGIEVGTQFQAGENAIVRPFARVGGTFYAGLDTTITAGFDGIGSTVSLPIGRDTVYGDVAAGVDVLTSGGWNLRALYTGRFSANSTSNAGTVKASVRF